MIYNLQEFDIRPSLSIRIIISGKQERSWNSLSTGCLAVFTTPHGYNYFMVIERGTFCCQAMGN
jgi:hypothetical protein